MILDKAAILGAMRLKTETVGIGAGEVIVSEIGAEDYFRIWTDPAYQTDGKVDMGKLRPALVAFCVVDEAGQRLFTDDEVAALKRSAPGPFNKLADSALKINGLVGDPGN